MKQLVSRGFPGDDGKLKVGGREFHHIAEVRRESEGSVIHVRLPDGAARPFKIESIDRLKKELCLAPAGAAVGEEARLPRIVLFQWMLKGRAMDLAIRQAAEVGVSLIVPVAGKRCVPQAKPGERLQRWERIIREARQQSGSAVSTEIAAATGVDGIPVALKGAGLESGALLVMLDEIAGSGAALHERVLEAKKGLGESGGFKAALAVGPEGGMAAEERDALASFGFGGVHFNTNILRAETAALYGLAALQNAIMELEKWQLNA